MPETWVRPPLLGREAPPAWRARWRFRAVMGVLLVLLLALLLAAYQELTGANDQDPGLGTDPGSSEPVRPRATAGS